jgi:hypothetical protein
MFCPPYFRQLCSAIHCFVRRCPESCTWRRHCPSSSPPLRDDESDRQKNLIDERIWSTKESDRQKNMIDRRIWSTRICDRKPWQHSWSTRIALFFCKCCMFGSKIDFVESELFWSTEIFLCCIQGDQMRLLKSRQKCRPIRFLSKLLHNFNGGKK